ncbi:MAG: hypothetical protein U9N58_08490, partial [Thermodesulfobacteriota bacterium]|nr:hypothetical protein [Thermodesulfobacteriota bacterium]
MQNYQTNKAKAEREKALFLKKQNLELLKSKYRTAEAMRAEDVSRVEADKERDFKIGKYKAEIAGRSDVARTKAKRRGIDGEKLASTSDLKYLDSKAQDIEDLLVTGEMGKAEAQAKVSELNVLRERFGQDPVELYFKTPGTPGEEGFLGSGWGEKDAIPGVLGLRVKSASTNMATDELAKKMVAALDGASPEQADEFIARAEKQFPGIEEKIRKLMGGTTGIMGSSEDIFDESTGIMGSSEDVTDESTGIMVKSDFEIEQDRQRKRWLDRNKKIDEEHRI